MKKTLFILATMAVSLATAEASTVLISFGTNSGPSTSIEVGTYLGESGQKVNKISTDGYNSYTSDVLITTDSNATGITLTTGSTCCGSAGVLSSSPNESAVEGQNNKFFDVFGAEMATGNPMGGVVNVDNSSLTTTLNHLSIGSYELTVLIGRGNAYGGANSSTYTIAGTNIANISASLDNYSTGSNASLSGNSITANTYNNDWILVTYSFDVTADDSNIEIKSQGGGGNFNALALTSESIPEPAVASLSLLGLGALMMRRRRA